MSVNSHSTPRAEARKLPAQARSRRTVEAILEAATHFFATRGYTETTTNAIAERAGVSIGSLYQYFPNKDALLVALEDRHLDEAGAVLRAAAAEWHANEPNVGEWAESFARLLVSVNDSELHRVIYNTAPPLPRIRSRVEALVGEIAGDVAFLLRRWGIAHDTRLQARVLVVAALGVAHEVVIQFPPGLKRARAQRQLRNLIASLASNPAWWERVTPGDDDLPH